MPKKVVVLGPRPRTRSESALEAARARAAQISVPSASASTLQCSISPTSDTVPAEQLLCVNSPVSDEVFSDAVVNSDCSSCASCISACVPETCSFELESVQELTSTNFPNSSPVFPESLPDECAELPPLSLGSPAATTMLSRALSPILDASSSDHSGFLEVSPDRPVPECIPQAYVPQDILISLPDPTIDITDAVHVPADRLSGPINILQIFETSPSGPPQASSAQAPDSALDFVAPVPLQQNENSHHRSDDAASASVLPHTNNRSSPDWGLLSHTSSQVIGETLHIAFPIMDPLPCPISSCAASFSASEWTMMLQSLKRHIEVAHDVRLTGTMKWCSICHRRAGRKPTTHSCIAAVGPLVPRAEASTYRCHRCDFSCPSKRGIRNHAAAHRRQDVANRNARRAAQQVPSPPATANVDANVAQASQPVEPAILLDSVNADNDVLDTSHAAPDAGLPDLPPQEPPPGPLQGFVQEFRALVQNSPSPESWESFTSLYDSMVADLQEMFKIRQNRPTGSPASAVDPTADARSIQRLYRRNRRRAMRLITQGSEQRCSLPVDVVQAHFTETWSPRDFDQSLFPPPSQRPPVLNGHFSAQEVRAKLFSSENSSPGADGLTYAHLKEADPDASCLAALFNVCVAHRRVPDCWRESTVILIPKKDDPTDIHDWRPISLSPTIYKMFTKCLAGRLSEWISEHDALSKSQKGFLPFDGVFENNFALQHLITQARSKKESLAIAWLDCTNAFGSLPHGAIVSALESAGVGDDLVELVKNIYSGTSSCIRTSGGLSNPIHIGSGIRQGCPLSGLLFNLTIDTILRRLEPSEPSKIGALAYADDLALIADSPADLQVLLDRAVALFGQLSIELNPRKSAALILDGTTHSRIGSAELFLQGVPLTCLEEGDAYRFLGKPVGYNICRTSSQADSYIAVAKKILSAKLAPWQRLDAMRTFFFPSLTFAMRTAQLSKTEWHRVDNAIRPLLKQTLNLPREASNEYIFGSRKKGCLGIPLAAEDSDIFLVDGAFKLLTSKDDRISQLAQEDLSATVTARLHHPAADVDFSNFLSGDNSGQFRVTTNAISNTWTLARSASTRLSIKWSYDGANSTITTPGGTSLNSSRRRKIAKTIREERRGARSNTLHLKPHQGKVMECVAADSSSSHFLYTGEYTRFADWRFIHRARLGTVPLNARSHLPAENQMCRRCGRQRETLPHVLNHCMSYSEAYQKRHNALVRRLRNAALGSRYNIISENQRLPESNLRPDLVISLEDRAYIIDVTVPFDNRPSAFLEARTLKISKYQPLATLLCEQFRTVTVLPFVVGSLGSWDPANDVWLKRLASRSYIKIFKRLCVSETIKWSRDIYIEHLTGRRQYTREVAPFSQEPQTQANTEVTRSQEEIPPTVES